MASQPIRWFLLALLAVATIATLSSTYLIYRNALDAAGDSLRLQAIGIAASIEPSLSQDIRRGENLFRPIVAESSWPGVAFIALYDAQGTTLLHSNDDLIGRTIESPELLRAASAGSAVAHYQLLGTGEEVFMLDYPFVARGGQRILRVALHPSQTRLLISHAIPQAISIAVMVVVLWLLGFFFLRAVRQSEELKEQIAERERFAVIGEMAAVLAHEIRNPLGSIKGYAQYLAEKHPPGSRDGESLGLIVAEAVRLERLAGDLLLYSRPAAPRVEAFELAELVRETASAFCGAAAAAGTSVHCTVTIPVRMQLVSDREKLKQILANIIQNGMDALGENGSIEIGGRIEGEHVTITVRDNGCGMDAETMAKACDSFFTTKAKGTGLGLAIVTRLVKAIQGTVSIESSPGSGSTVTVRLPLTLKGEGNG